MKWNKIKKLCMDRHVIDIINTPTGAQWIADGANAWAVDGLRLSEDSVPAVLDLTDKDLTKVGIREINSDDPRFAARDYYGGEEELEIVGYIWEGGDLYMALIGAGGLMLIPDAALKPMRLNEDYVRCCLRRREGFSPMVAVYDGLCCLSLHTPVTKTTAAIVMRAAWKAAAAKLWTEDEDDGQLGDGMDGEMGFDAENGGEADRGNAR